MYYIMKISYAFSLVSDKEEEKELFHLIDGIRWSPEWSLESLHYALSYQSNPDDLLYTIFKQMGDLLMQIQNTFLHKIQLSSSMVK
jgi:hypothetical protein